MTRAPSQQGSWTTNPLLATVCHHQLSSWAGPHPIGRSRLWWSNLTYVPVSYTTWHSPLISRSKGPHLPSVPRLRFTRAPTVPHCTLRGPASREEQKVTFQLSFPTLSSSTPTLVDSRLGLFWESLDPSKASLCQDWLQKEVEGVWCVCLQCEEAAKESLKSVAPGFESLTVCFCVHALAPCALVPTGSVCMGRWGWAERCSK